MNIQDILKSGEKRWYIYDDAIGNDSYCYDLILDFKTGLVWVNGDKYDHSFVSKTKSNIDLSFEHSNFRWRLPTFEELENVSTDYSFPLHADCSNACLYPEICQEKYSNRRGLFPFYVKDYSGNIKIAKLDDTPIGYCTDRDNSENLIIAVTDEFKIKAEAYCNLADFFAKCGIDTVNNSEICNKLKNIYRNCVSISVLCQIYEKFGIVPKNIEMDFSSADILKENIFSFFETEFTDKLLNKYCESLKMWIDILIECVEEKEHKFGNIIEKVNDLCLKLNKKYVASDNLTEEENALLRERQRFFASRFSLGMNGIKTKLLAVKHQADELEYRIDEIDDGDNAIQELALLEEEKRASFEFLAENTAKIVRNALKKIEYFEANHDYVAWAVQAWESWSESYRVFRTTYFEDMRSSCDECGIEEEIWRRWYDEWQAVRFKIEEKLQPIIEKELRSRILTMNESGIFVAQQIITELEIYRNNVDSFYREERTGIYQSFVFQPSGDLQDKLETESRLYKITAEFQKSLQDIIFNCANAEDRIFILDWASSLLDIQIDDVLDVTSDSQLDKIAETILNEFSELKKKNYELYLADAKSYGEEKARRDKEFNALMFKMRKALNAK